MSLPLAFLIMMITGILGGSVNYLLPANENYETLKRIRTWLHCVVLGFGATFLIPLFLEIAQSKLLDNMHMGWNWVEPKNEKNAAEIKKDTANSKRDTVVLKIKPADTFKRKPAETTYTPLRTPPKPNPVNHAGNQPDGGGRTDSNPLKSYLLFGAYCLLAAAAGFKFINMLINNVVKDQELTAKTNKIEDLQKEKEKREKNSQISQQQDENKVRQELLQRPFGAAAVANNQNFPIQVFPVLPPVIHPADPQKGRFGGKSKNNFREIKADVTKSNVPGFYNVKIWVESTDIANHPLNSDVIFYIHDSFSPSVYSIKPIEFLEGKAIDDEIISYGAFTVGAITDDGQTMLELDLAVDSRFPKEFRER